MGRAYQDNEGTVHIVRDSPLTGAETDGFWAIHERLRAAGIIDTTEYRIVVERHEDDPDDDTIDKRGALVAALVGVVLTFAGMFAWVAWWRP